MDHSGRGPWKDAATREKRRETQPLERLPSESKLRRRFHRRRPPSSAQAQPTDNTASTPSIIQKGWCERTVTDQVRFRYRKPCVRLQAPRESTDPDRELRNGREVDARSEWSRESGGFDARCAGVRWTEDCKECYRLSKRPTTASNVTFCSTVWRQSRKIDRRSRLQMSRNVRTTRTERAIEDITAARSSEEIECKFRLAREISKDY
ncbi:MAG: hypothetical protein MHPSP_000636 [Paramarteilia canceri]